MARCAAEQAPRKREVEILRGGWARCRGRNRGVAKGGSDGGCRAANWWFESFPVVGWFEGGLEVRWCVVVSGGEKK